MSEEITYYVEYDEIVHRRCKVTLTVEQDRQFNSTGDAVRAAVNDGETDEDYEIDSGTDVTLWRRS